MVLRTRHNNIGTQYAVDTGSAVHTSVDDTSNTLALSRYIIVIVLITYI